MIKTCMCLHLQVSREIKKTVSVIQTFGCSYEESWIFFSYMVKSFRFNFRCQTKIMMVKDNNNSKR